MKTTRAGQIHGALLQYPTGGASVHTHVPVLMDDHLELICACLSASMSAGSQPYRIPRSDVMM